MVGSVLTFVLGFLEIEVPAGPVLLGLGVLWMGYALWSGAEELAGETQPAT